jgi:hypothetical protein
MAQVRDDLQAEVVEVVEQARGLTDWKGLVAKHPLIALTAAAAIGFLIVPRRSPTGKAKNESSENGQANGYAGAKPHTHGSRVAVMVSPVLTAVAHAVMRGVMARVGEQVAGIVSGTRRAGEPGVPGPSVANRSDRSGDPHGLT